MGWTLRGMDDRQLLAAAEFARRSEVWDRAINTADRTAGAARLLPALPGAFPRPGRAQGARSSRSTTAGSMA